jgi:hypothetical protein
VPFFFQDHRHAFFVRPVVSDIELDSNQDLGIQTMVVAWAPPTPETTVVPDPPYEMPPRPIYFPPEPIAPGGGDPAAARAFLDEHVYVNQVIASGGTFVYEGRPIGPGGVLRFRHEGT